MGPGRALSAAAPLALTALLGLGCASAPARAPERAATVVGGDLRTTGAEAAPVAGDGPEATAPAPASPPQGAEASSLSIPAPMGTVVVTGLQGPAIDFGATVSLRLHTQLGGHKQAPGELLRNDYPRALAVEAPVQAHLEASFLIDFDEPSVLALAQQLRAQLGDSPSSQQLRQAVAAHIERPEYGNWHIASRVVERRAGDCTEHAVLLAALARRFGHPARVVIGYVILPEHGAALGHAWNEVYEGGAWHALDATTDVPIDSRYVRLGAVEREDPGYSVGVVRLLQATPVQRIEIVR